MKPLRAAAAALLLAAGPAAAQVSGQQIQQRYTPAFAACMASPRGQSTSGMIDCIGAELKIQDGRLNATYRKTLKGLTPAEAQRLKMAERAWQDFRDADCFSLEDVQQWGSISRVNANRCMLDRTIIRTIELENFPPREQ